MNGEIFQFVDSQSEEKRVGERNGGGRQTVVIIISTCCMEVILNKIEEQLSALDRQLESISIRS